MQDFSLYPRFKEFRGKTILAIDYGSKVIGTALFCPGKDPFPLMAEKIIVRSEAQVMRDLQLLIEAESVEIIVLGVPYYLDGNPSENSLNIKSFGEKLQGANSTLPFFEQDETLTTKAAEDRMKNSAQFNFQVDPLSIDCVSATIILEDFIRS